jgi:UTP--glucose-1-phosphate uridylyltransferase
VRQTVILADDLIDSEPSVMKQMTDLYEQQLCSILGVQNVAREETSAYGIVAVKPDGGRSHETISIVEKPKPVDAPSTLAVVGRYILTPRIFHHLENIQPGTGGEIQLTDGIAALLQEERVLAYEFQGKRYDCGSKLGYLKATVEYALRHAEVGNEFRAYLTNMQGRSAQ